jgi:hypothetical protein
MTINEWVSKCKIFTWGSGLDVGMRIPARSGPMQQVTYLILDSAGPDPSLAHPLDPPPWLHLIYHREICNIQFF